MEPLEAINSVIRREAKLSAEVFQKRNRNIINTTIYEGLLSS
jgi:hypothetical protein